MLLRGIIVVRPVVTESKRCKVNENKLFIRRTEGDRSFFVADKHLAIVTSKSELV